MSIKGSVISFPRPLSPHGAFFSRAEMRDILRWYASLVAAGKLKDYAIFETRVCAIFAFYGRARERPLYRIVKDMSHRSKGSVFRILGGEGQVLKEGRELSTVLEFFYSKLLRLISA